MDNLQIFEGEDSIGEKNNILNIYDYVTTHIPSNEIEKSCFYDSEQDKRWKKFFKSELENKVNFSI